MDPILRREDEPNGRCAMHIRGEPHRGRPPAHPRDVAGERDGEQVQVKDCAGMRRANGTADLAHGEGQGAYDGQSPQAHARPRARSSRVQEGDHQL